ncbi:serine hydrolase [Crossiella sp. CA-258035]|uniref:serine hydrolase n=1 Tax=Crossiella sp. CA-258035 TaxID=2981138 RepID=UPI0024BC1373|nr:serine hydrolase [Crossiella sp. CA-258035]WHT15918.1 serine hydrolase [Crossiella sp. CA-258035]
MRVRLWLPLGLVAVVATTVVLTTSFGRDPWRTDCAGPLVAPKAASGSAAAVQAAVAASAKGATVGYEVLDLSACRVVAGVNSQQRFAAASVVKLLIALDALDRQGEQAEDRVQRMLSVSDDATASALWTAHGGPEIVKRVAGKLKLGGVRPPERAGQWGDTQVTAHDVALVYRHISAAETKDRRRLLTSAMAEAPRAAADGFDQHFGIPDGLPGSRWAIKQGWGSSGERTVLHSTGLVGGDRQYAVVLLSSWPLGMDRMAAGRALTAGAGRVSEPAAAH